MICTLILALSMPSTQAFGGDLEDVLEAGKLRHLGIPYANFVSNQGDGLDVEVMKLFANYLGVKYEFVESTAGTTSLRTSPVKPSIPMEAR